MGKKAITERIRRAQAAGWDVKDTGSGHTQVRPPGGKPITMASTPSDWRAERNIDSQLRRAGLDTHTTDLSREARMRKAKTGTFEMQILRYLEDITPQVVNAVQVCQKTGIQRTYVSQILANLAKKDGNVIRVQHGHYMWRLKPGTEPEPEPEPETPISLRDILYPQPDIALQELRSQMAETAERSGVPEVEVPITRRRVSFVPTARSGEQIFRKLGTAGPNDEAMVIKDTNGVVFIAFPVWWPDKIGI